MNDYELIAESIWNTYSGMAYLIAEKGRIRRLGRRVVLPTALAGIAAIGSQSVETPGLVRTPTPGATSQTTSKPTPEPTWKKGATLWRQNNLGRLLPSERTSALKPSETTGQHRVRNIILPQSRGSGIGAGTGPGKRRGEGPGGGPGTELHQYGGRPGGQGSGRKTGEGPKVQVYKHKGKRHHVGGGPLGARPREFYTPDKPARGPKSKE